MDFEMLSIINLDILKQVLENDIDCDRNGPYNKEINLEFVKLSLCQRFIQNRKNHTMIIEKQ